MGYAFAAVFALVGWWRGLRPLGDNSFLTHLATGRWILDHGLPRADPFSFTAPGDPWVLQSWLVELLYAGLDRSFGGSAIQLLNAAAGAGIGWSAYRLALRLSGDRVRAALLTASALSASVWFWWERPLLFGIAFLLALVWAVECPGSPLGRRPLVTLPILFWLWTSSHGTFALGYVYLGLHLAGRWAEGERPSLRHGLLPAALLAFAAGFANPYGWRLVAFPAKLMARGSVLENISEWQSPSFRVPLGMLLALFLGLTVVILARTRPGRRDLLVVLPFLFLALWAQRNIALAPLVVLPVLARLVERAETPERRAGRPFAVTASAAVLAIAASFLVQSASAPAYGLGRSPVAAVRAVEREGLIGRRILTVDAWGCYLIYAYAGRQPVFVDDRFDLYPERVTGDYLKLLDGDRDWRAILGRYAFDVVVWPEEKPLSEYLAADPGWRQVFRDAMAAVYVRTPP
ncbi:hypothetical protein [Actinocorallia longicatena]|uniref:Glycosyltransferase RgtA/B/C/D-like domain-containing protein n=1 Tax=Actinocorallia longicatena TaxID=111803 RepID=A0ABP6QHF1_9ACTN